MPIKQKNTFFVIYETIIDKGYNDAYSQVLSGILKSGFKKAYLLSVMN
jgi:hypothetical protein